ncbi:MAG: DNA-directed RNA polymerase subunit alpha [Pirellulales bacterium]|nr:DNA-directed RNA polymerase subunit alpha [Pirellulales bacterium]
MRIRWRGLELPSQVTCDGSTLTSTYGKFVAEPFERGFGATVGNSLRRVMLSSLEGSAVTQVRLHGAQHEFTTVPGVVEDVTDIILNIKALVVQNHSEQTRVVRIDKSARGAVTGADVVTDGVVDVINKDHVIATLTDDVPFLVEMVVENGRGYVPATDSAGITQEIGTIPVDAAFSPVVRVRYEVEETRVGQKTNYDKLTMEIWTNGSITPELALVEAAKILRKHLNPFVQYQELGPRIFSEARPAGPAGIDPATEAKLAMPLAELDLSVRASNCLESENIHTVRDLVTHSEDQLLEVRNFGETTLMEIREKLASIGLHLGMRLPSAMSRLL